MTKAGPFEALASAAGGPLPGLRAPLRPGLLDLEYARETEEGIQLTRPEDLLRDWAAAGLPRKREQLDCYAPGEPAEVEAALGSAPPEPVLLRLGSSIIHVGDEGCTAEFDVTFSSPRETSAHAAEAIDRIGSGAYCAAPPPPVHSKATLAGSGSCVPLTGAVMVGRSVGKVVEARIRHSGPLPSRFLISSKSCRRTGSVLWSFGRFAASFERITSSRAATATRRVRMII